MLKRQQAEAFGSAPKKSVEGAVSMVEQAMSDLADKQVVALDQQQKAQPASHMLVVLCSETDTAPMIDTSAR